jgi:hypothetical protein
VAYASTNVSLNCFKIFTGCKANTHCRFLTLAFSHDFVRYALLSLSARHLKFKPGFENESKLAVTRYRAAALGKLQDAVGNFSRENSDAILATSILLSWQSDDMYVQTSL